MKRDLPVRILALGDSYTIGEGVQPAERWPEQLANRLRAAGWGAAEPLIVARTGWTTDELAEGIARASVTGPFDLVALLIGVNNQYRGRVVGEYHAQFRDLLRQAIAFAGNRPGRVLVLSIPDWGVTPFGRDRGEDAQKLIAGQIDAFNAVSCVESLSAGAKYVDITPISRERSGEPGWLAGDGLHPSGKMYAAWVEKVLPVALEALQE